MKTTTRPLHHGWKFQQLDAEKIPNSDASAWLPATVPGHVHLDLVANGVIPDPFVRMNERGVQWVDDTGWAYWTKFDMAADELAGARHLLRFDGLDTIATILLNNAEIATTDNMFIAHTFDVTDALREGKNTLEVRFASADRVGRERLETSESLAPHLAGPERNGLFPRSMVRKAQYMWGWDWGPRLRGCGIWGPVSLVRVPAARVDEWSWQATFGGAGAATVAVRVVVDGAADTIAVTLRGHGVDLSADAAVVAGVAELSFVVDEPERWWPAGSGAQPLYDLSVQLRAGDAVVDELAHRIGLREVELVREPDDAGESFFFRVNGVPIFAKGANWIPDDSFPARTTRARVHANLTLARDCGMNMIRIWGGGLYESTDFYDACDELGLLVWQDFPYACALYPDDDATVEVAVAEATTAVKRVRNHTSLALWCGNNENQWLAGFGIYGPNERVLGDRLYDIAFPAVVAEHDPLRPYWPSSPWGTMGGGPSGEGDGDCHYWNVWHGEGDWVHYEKCTARFVSEFGFSGPPAIRTLEEVLDPGDLGVDTPAMRWHDKTSKGYETYLGYIALHYPAPQTLPDLVYYGQLNQADAMRFGIEHFRRLRPHTMGTLVWQLNDCWPVQSWAWIDYQLRPKAAWYAAKRFYAPLLLSLSRADDRVIAHLVNDDVDGRAGTLRLRAIDAEGNELWSESADVKVDGLASNAVADLALPAHVLDASRRVLVHATFDDVESSLLLAEPKDLVLGTPRVTVSVDEKGVTLSTETLALSVMLWAEGLEVVWSDNFFHLLPGEPRVVTATAPGVTPSQLAAAIRYRTL